MVSSFLRACAPFRRLNQFAGDQIGVLLVQGPPGVIVHLPAGSADVEHVLLPQRGVFIEDGDDGPFEVADALRGDGAPHGFAAVEGVLLRYGTVEATGGVTRIQLDLQEHDGLLHVEVLQAERAPLGGRAQDGREGDDLLLLLLLVERDAVGTDPHGPAAVLRVEHLLPEAVQLRYLLEEPVLRGGGLHPLEALVLLDDPLQQIGGLVGAVAGHDGRGLHVDRVRGAQGVVIPGLGLGDEGYQLRDAVPVGGREPFFGEVEAGVQIKLVSGIKGRVNALDFCSESGNNVSDVGSSASGNFATRRCFSEGAGN